MKELKSIVIDTQKLNTQYLDYLINFLQNANKDEQLCTYIQNKVNVTLPN